MKYIALACIATAVKAVEIIKSIEINIVTGEPDEEDYGYDDDLQSTFAEHDWSYIYGEPALPGPTLRSSFVP